MAWSTAVPLTIPKNGDYSVSILIGIASIHAWELESDQLRKMKKNCFKSYRINSIQWELRVGMLVREKQEVIAT